MNRWLFILLLAVAAQGQNFDLTIDNIMRGPNLYGWEPNEVRWSPDGSKVYFSWKQWNDPLEHDRDTYVVSRDGSGLRKLSDDEKKDAPPFNGDRSRDKRMIVYADDGDIYLWDGKRRAITQTTEVESSPHFTFDEQHVTFVRDNNVFEVSLRDGSTIQLTNIAGPDDKGTNVTLWDDKKGTESQEYIKREERKLLTVVDEHARKREEDEARKKKEHPVKPFKLEKRQSVTDGQLTPDGKYVVVVIRNESDKAKRAIVPSYVTESAYTDTIPSREKVGDALPVTRIAVLSAANGDVKWFEHGLKPPEQGATEKTEKVEATKPKEREVALRTPVWSDDGKRAFVFVRSTDNKDAWIMAFDPANPKGRAIVAMHDDAWLRSFDTPAPGWLGDKQTIYYASEATGFMHLYEVPFDGTAVRPMTQGNWEVDSVTLSSDKKYFYLTTSEESPFERHLYRMPVAGGNRVKLTSTPGDHEAVVSPDGAGIADVYSYTNRPPELFITEIPLPATRGEGGRRPGEGKRVTTSPAPEFANYPWLDVPIVRIPARDGVQVPARIYKPANFQRGGSAVVFVHGAGYLQNVHRWWSSYAREYMFHHLLMSRGYLVLDVDYRGSRGYGRDWRTAIYRHMGGKDLDDQIDAAKWLVTEHGVDPKHIGVYGGSYGGFITLMAMFTQPDVFAAGAALRPVTDWAHYNNGYTSAILNFPQSDAEAYRQSSPIYFAQGLKGRLLICHGMVDTNVHFQDSVRLVQRLIELRKTNWELAVFPVENHGFVEPTSWADEYKRIFKLFEETLRPANDPTHLR
jgi:dipeptidyl aminopeptidase/acylaminoacyl peptidase